MLHGLRRKSIILVVILALAWGGIMYGARLATRAPSISHHEDPALATLDSDPTAIFAWYRVALTPFAVGRFHEGRQLLRALASTTLPPEVQSLVGDLNESLLEEGTTLEEAEGLLRQASDLISAGKLNTAKPLLARLNRLARQGSVLFEEGVGELSELARRTNLEALPSYAPQRRAYEDLQRLAARVKALLVTFRAFAQNPKAIPAFARLLGYPTTIDLSVPKSAYPGRGFIVDGVAKEHAPKPSRGRRLTIFFDDQVLGEFGIGRFIQEFLLPAGTIPGQHRLRAVIPGKDKYLGASVDKPLQVILAPVDLQVSAPRYSLAPHRLEIMGTTSSAFGPVVDAHVQISIGSTTGEGRTSGTGEFRVALDLPASVNLVGPETLSVHVFPVEPWHAPSQQHHDVFIINLVTTGLMSLLVPVAGLAYGTSRRPTKPLIPPKALPNVQLASTPVDQTTDKSAGQVVGDRFLSSYIAILRRFQAVTSIPLHPSTTLREFAALVRDKLSSETFSQMTALAEIVLYSPHPLSQGQLEYALRLKDQLDLELASASK